MNIPEEQSKDARPVATDTDIDALMESLPAAYADWERSADSVELERIRSRIVKLINDTDKTSQSIID